MSSLGAWDDYLRLGIVLFKLFPAEKVYRDMAELIPRLVQDGFFSVVEIPELDRDETIDRIKTCKEYADLVLSSQPKIARERLNLSSSDECERAYAVEVLKGLIDQAYRLGAEMMITYAGTNSDPGPGGQKRQMAFINLTKSLKELCRYARDKAEDYVLKISLENSDRYGQKRCLIGPTVEARRLAESVSEENFGLTLDMAHLPLLDETPEEALAATGEYLCHIHLGNCMKDPSHPKYGDTHPPFGIPESLNGAQEIAEFLDMLFQVNFLKKEPCAHKPIVSFELAPFDLSAEEVINRAKNVFLESWEGLREKRGVRWNSRSF